MKSLRFTTLTLLFALFSLSLSAQERFTGGRDCGVTERSPWMVRYQAGEIPPVGKSLMTQFVPLRMVIVGNNDGSRYIDPVKLFNSFELLNSDYEDMNIQFYLAEIDFLDRTSYNENPSRSEIVNMMELNNRAGFVNSYVIAEQNGICGTYYGGPDALILIQSCLGASDRTWSHEMGHLLTLDHTFYGWESVGKIDSIDLNKPAPATLRYRSVDVPVERTDGSNCETAADGFCDTSPDYLMERWRCENDNEYQDSLLDPDSIRFAVPAWNIMSYALDNCITGFSEEQKTAMQTNLDARSISDDSGTDRVAADGETLELISPINNATLDFSNLVELNWTPVANADFYIVQLNTISNFNGGIFSSFLTTDTTATITEGLNPGARYYWRVRPVNRYKTDSDFGDQTFRFRNGSFPVATIDAALNAAVSVVPNPVAGGNDILLNGRDLGVSGKMNYELIDAAGRILVSRENVNVTAAGFSERIETTGLSAGVYFLRLRLNEKLVTKRVMVTP